jgi:hypothetical protein
MAAREKAKPLREYGNIGTYAREHGNMNMGTWEHFNIGTWVLMHGNMGYVVSPHMVFFITTSLIVHGIDFDIIVHIHNSFFFVKLTY